MKQFTDLRQNSAAMDAEDAELMAMFKNREKPGAVRINDMYLIKDGDRLWLEQRTRVERRRAVKKAIMRAAVLAAGIIVAGTGIALKMPVMFGGGLLLLCTEAPRRTFF